MVDADGLGDLEEPDQFEPVQPLGPGLVAVDLGEPGVNGRVGGDESIDVGEPEEAPHAVHHRGHRGVHEPTVVELADVQLDVGTVDPDQRIQSIALTPGEPALQLVGNKW